MDTNMETPKRSLRSNHTPKWKWTPEEDAILREAIDQQGPSHWGRIAALLPGRNGKQCRERWIGKLSPSISQEAWTTEEDLALMRFQSAYGNLWAKIAPMMPGRTVISIKNRWCWLVRRNIPEQFKKTGFDHDSDKETILPLQKQKYIIPAQVRLIQTDPVGLLGDSPSMEYMFDDFVFPELDVSMGIEDPCIFD